MVQAAPVHWARLTVWPALSDGANTIRRSLIFPVTSRSTGRVTAAALALRARRVPVGEGVARAECPAETPLCCPEAVVAADADGSACAEAECECECPGFGWLTGTPSGAST
jgi:hypothetical protein